jgi:hypothetical protein
VVRDDLVLDLRPVALPDVGAEVVPPALPTLLRVACSDVCRDGRPIALAEAAHSLAEAVVLVD